MWSLFGRQCPISDHIFCQNWFVFGNFHFFTNILLVVHPKMGKMRKFWLLETIKMILWSWNWKVVVRNFLGKSVIALNFLIFFGLQSPSFLIDPFLIKKTCSHYEILGVLFGTGWFQIPLKVAKILIYLRNI